GGRGGRAEAAQGVRRLDAEADPGGLQPLDQGGHGAGADGRQGRGGGLADEVVGRPEQPDEGGRRRRGLGAGGGQGGGGAGLDEGRGVAQGGAQHGQPSGLVVDVPEGLRGQDANVDVGVGELAHEGPDGGLRLGPEGAQGAGGAAAHVGVVEAQGGGQQRHLA